MKIRRVISRGLFEVGIGEVGVVMSDVEGESEVNGTTFQVRFVPTSDIRCLSKLLTIARFVYGTSPLSER